ncbi:MAG: hypothetical protein JSR20_06085 [Nitrospira sp.]|nr:hypothetical protein [Nitrospira sp.]
MAEPNGCGGMLNSIGSDNSPFDVVCATEKAPGWSAVMIVSAASAAAPAA